jgi:YegS/Rv2252/BmrU family lipid kinase
MKTLFIVNPAAGHGRGHSRWAQVEDRALAAYPGSRVKHTAKIGEAAGLVRVGLEEGFQAIVAVGGDGTVGEMVDGYLSAPEPLRIKSVLGALPVGSGCDLARHLGLGREPEDVLKLLARPNVKRLDAGVVEFHDDDGRRAKRYFINVVSLGLGGEVGRRIAASGKPLGGTLSYMGISLACLARAKPYALSLIVDGKEEPETPYHLIAVANTSTTGGGMSIAPAADAHDGLLDLVSVGGLSRLDLFRRFPSIYSGGHIGKPGIAHRLVRRVEVRSSETVYLNIDGEAMGLLPAVFEAMPAAVPFLLPI